MGNGTGVTKQKHVTLDLNTVKIVSVSPDPHTAIT